LLYQRRDGASDQPAKESADMATNFDLKPHEQQWHTFIRIMTYAVAGCVTVLVLMAIFLL
jgi:hypothetical protein